MTPRSRSSSSRSDHGLQRGPAAAVLGGEVVDHEFVDGQVTQWPAAAGERADLIGGRGAAADDDAGILVAESAVAGARIGDLPRGAVLEVDLVLVLVEVGWHLDLGADRPEHSPGIVAGLHRERQSAAEVPVLTPEELLEVTAHPDCCHVWVCPGREEDPELQLTARLVAPELPGPASLIHEDHRLPLGRGRMRRKTHSVVASPSLVSAPSLSLYRDRARRTANRRSSRTPAARGLAVASDLGCP